MRFELFLAVVMASGLLVACGDDSGGGDDGGMPDAMADGAMDSAPDTTPPVDSAMPDTAVPDAGPSCTTGCDIEEVRLGFIHSCARRANGEVLCWGGNREGDLGDGRTRHADCTPEGATERQDCSAEPVTVSLAGPADALYANGGRSACAALDSGEVHCWGNEGVPPLGSDTLLRRFEPDHQTTWDGALEISDSRSHTCAIMADNTVECVWQNTLGQLGNGTFIEQLTPVVATAVADAQEVDVSTFPGDFTCVRTGSDIQCWGNNRDNQLGDGREDHAECGDDTTVFDCSADPVVVTGLTDAIQMVAGARHVCVIHDGGTVSCWGSNDAGQLGAAAGASVAAPTLVDGLTGVTQLAAGADHTCALKSDGDVVCFGSNDDGQLGDGMMAGHELCSVGVGTTDCSSTPVTVVLPEAATFIAAGFAHGCAILTGGDVYCWGWNDAAQVGQIDRAPRATPEMVTGF